MGKRSQIMNSHGCADFSVSQANLEQATQYIANQDELRALLRKHEIEWDKKYVWD